MAVVGHISIVMFNLRPAHPLFEPLRDCEELIHNTALLIRLLVEVFHRPQHAPATAYPIDLTDREIGNRIFSIIDNQSPSATIIEQDLSAQIILKIVAIAMAKRMKRVLATIETQTKKIFRDRDIRVRCGEHGRQIGIHLQRGIRIAEALLDFAKPQVIHKIPLDLNAAAREAVSAFSACFSGLRITLECAAEPLVVRGDSYWLRKLLLELLSNANDACSGGGEVCLKILEKRAAVHPALSTNSTKRRKAQLIVADNGPGLPACLGIHAFDPFTCAPGGRRRRGLGLAVVSGIVSALGGRIRFFNRPRGGFVINIELPLPGEA
jgi:C4-dicarboxylate-specific signal transduction histidine kinase